jgi:hypothetical protein
VSLSFYLDHHVPAVIAAGLRQLQIDVLTVAEDGRADWDDDRLLERALELGRIVFTQDRDFQDRDFLVLAARWQQDRREFAGMVYGHQLRVTVGGAVRDIALIASVMTGTEMRNRVEFLPL